MTDVVQNSIAVTPTIAQSDIDSLEKLYTFRGKEEIVEFVEKYPFLVAPLLSAPEKIRRYFPDEQLFLEVIPDPEIINYVLLVLSILTTLDPYEATNRESQVDKEWLLSLSYEVRNKLCVLLEFPDEF